MNSLSIERAITQAKAYAKKGKINEAKKIYETILEKFPQNQRAQKGLIALAKQRNRTLNVLIENEINQLLSLLNQGRLLETVSKAKILIAQYPDAFFVWNVLGAANKGLGKVLEASQAFLKVTELEPKYADGHNNLGLTLAEMGNHNDAIKAYQKALLIKPDYPQANYNLGISLQNQGNFEHAIEAYKKALSIRPKYAQAHYNIGVILQIQNNLDAAIAAFKEALLIKPDYAEAANNIGLSFHIQGNLDAAIKAFESALSLKPDYAAAYVNIGLSLHIKGNLVAAIEAYEKALTIEPRNVHAFNNMGNSLKDQGKLEKAVCAYRSAVSLQPNYVQAYNNMGNAFKDQGKLDEAIKAYEKAFSLKPDFADALNNLGNAYKYKGEFESATRAYSTALSLQPDLAVAHRNLTSITKYQIGDTQIDAVTELLENTDLSSASKCELRFALAKMKEDIGDLRGAFDNYVFGGNLRRQILDYTFDQDQALFDKIKRASIALNEVRLASFKDKPRKTPIFILGMPRSGTTLFEQIVSCHSKVQAAGELPFLSLYGSTLSTGEMKPDQKSLLKFRESYLTELSNLSSDKPFVTDKFPHNFLHLALIFKAIPEAKVVHIKRDPRATCWSNFKHYFPTRGLGYSYDLSETVKYYKMYQDLMDFWDKHYGNKILHMDYDSLTSKQDPETRRLITWLGLAWEKKCLSPHENQRTVLTISHQQVRKKIYTGSSQEWRSFEAYIGSLFDDLV